MYMFNILMGACVKKHVFIFVCVCVWVCECQMEVCSKLC